MRVVPSQGASQAWATLLAQTTCRVAAHRSTPTDKPVTAPDKVAGNTVTRPPSRHTFDIRV